MINEYKEDIKSDFDFEGTVIDIETIGEFCKEYRNNDSRQCRNHQQFIFGFINRRELHILYATNEREIPDLNKKTIEVIRSLKKPFYGFNCNFERAVWFHQIGVKIDFDGELQRFRYEKKADALRELRIPNYDDPFCDNGLLCMQAWERGECNKAIKHNRACLLKERDILLRGYREPEVLEFVR